MILSESQLRMLIAGQPFGDFPPYQQGDQEGIEGYLRRIVAGLTRSKLIEVEAIFNHYGSGYASYVDIFCYKRKGLSTRHEKGVKWINGITVYLSRLAPFSAWGPGERTRHETGGSSDYLEGRKVGELPPGDWAAEVNEITTKLVTEYGITIPSREELVQRLPFKAIIPTILGDPPYTVFDALFYWED